MNLPAVYDEGRRRLGLLGQALLPHRNGNGKALRTARALRHPSGTAEWQFWPASELVTDATDRLDYAAAVGDGLGSSVISAALCWLMRTFPEAPAVLQRLEQDQWRTVRRHTPYAELLASPNPFYDGRILWMATCVDFAFGEAYWLKARNSVGDVLQLWWAPRALMTPKAPPDGSTFISHYEYRVGGETFRVDPREVVHFRFGLDPHNVRRGFSQLAGVMREVYTDEQACTFTAAILRNLGVIGVVISPKEKERFDAEAVKEVRDYIKASFTGARRGETLAVGTPTEAHLLQYNLQGFDVGPIRDISEERVCAALGIPAAVIGFGTGLQQTKVGAPQPLSARLWTPTGPTTMGDVQPGDLIAIPGGWSRVKHVYPQGLQDIYRISFQDGSIAESTADHLWDVHLPNHAERQVLPLSVIARMPWWQRRRASVPLQGVTEFADQPTLIPPYVMGLLLADGSFCRNLFFSNADAEIVGFMREEVGVGYDINHSQGVDYRIAYRDHGRGRGLGGGSGNLNPFVEELRRLELWMLYSHEKFIPDLYKYNSSRVRRELLRGLLDGDGYVNLHGQPALEQTSARLAADVTFLVQSLGGYTLQSVKRADRRVRRILGRPMHSNYDRYHQSIVIEDGGRLFRCAAKAGRCRPRTKSPTRKFRSIEWVRREAAQCIEVDGGLYLTDNFIVTHNTMRELARLAWAGCIMPMQKIMAGALDRALLPDFYAEPTGFRTAFDATEVRAVWEDEKEKGDRVARLFTSGVIKRSEARAEIGYSTDEGDDLFVLPTTVAPEGEAPPDGTTKPPTPAGAAATD